MQGRKHLVSGHGAAESHPRRILVADLADQDDIGVLAEDRSHAVGEIEAHGVVDRSLADLHHRILDRILEGHDIDPFGVQVTEQGVQGRGLAAARRAGDEDQTLRPGHHDPEDMQHLFVESEPLHGDQPLLSIEDAQDDVLAMQGG